MRSRVFTQTHIVAFHEVDLAGFAHFSHYFQWMEHVEHAFLKSLNIPIIQKEASTLKGWPRVNVNIHYQRAATLDTTITINLHIKKLLPKGIHYEFQFYHQSELLAESEMTTLYTTISGTDKPQAQTLPQNIITRLTPYIQHEDT